MSWVLGIRKMVMDMIKPAHRRGLAINIDLDKCTCDVDLENGAMLHDVKLKAVEAKNDKGIVIVPKNKTYVVAAMVEGLESDWCLVQVEEIDSAAYFFKNGGKFELKDNGEVHLNGDNLGALPVIQKVVDKIKQLEQKHNALVAKFNSHKHTGVFVGAATSGPGDTPSMDNIAQLTTVDDLKNDKVKQGG